jgi:hypothetical protein
VLVMAFDGKRVRTRLIRQVMAPANAVQAVYEDRRSPLRVKSNIASLRGHGRYSPEPIMILVVAFSITTARS